MNTKSFIFVVIMSILVLSACAPEQSSQESQDTDGVILVSKSISPTSLGVAFSICNNFSVKLDEYGKYAGIKYETDSQILSVCQTSLSELISNNDGKMPEGSKIVLGGISESHEFAMLVFKDLSDSGALKDFGSFSHGEIVKLLKLCFAQARDS